MLFKHITFNIIQELEDIDGGHKDLLKITFYYFNDGMLLAGSAEEAEQETDKLKRTGRECGLEINRKAKLSSIT